MRVAMGGASRHPWLPKKKNLRPAGAAPSGPLRGNTHIRRRFSPSKISGGTPHRRRPRKPPDNSQFPRTLPFRSQHFAISPSKPIPDIPGFRIGRGAEPCKVRNLPPRDGRIQSASPQPREPAFSPFPPTHRPPCSPLGEVGAVHPPQCCYGGRGRSLARQGVDCASPLAL